MHHVIPHLRLNGRTWCGWRVYVVTMFATLRGSHQATCWLHTDCFTMWAEIPSSPSVVTPTGPSQCFDLQRALGQACVWIQLCSLNWPGLFFHTFTPHSMEFTKKKKPRAPRAAEVPEPRLHARWFFFWLSEIKEKRIAEQLWVCVTLRESGARCIDLNFKTVNGIGNRHLWYLILVMLLLQFLF